MEMRRDDQLWHAQQRGQEFISVDGALLGAELLIERHRQGDRVRAELHGRRPEPVGRLQGMSPCTRRPQT